MEHPSQLLDMLDFEEAVQADLAPLQDMALGAKLLPASPLLSEDDVQPAAADEDVEGPQAFLAAAGTVFEEYEADGEAEDEVVEAASDDSSVDYATVEQIRWLMMQARQGGLPPIKVKEPLLSSFDLSGVAQLILSGRVRRIVCMCGAGISVSAGIPDFRSPGTGLYHRLQEYNLPYPQAVFEIDFFKENPRPFFLLAKELFPGTFTPTPTHYFLKLLYDKGLLLRCFTQNIDSLEHQAGLPKEAVVAAHGNFDSARCIRCGQPHDVGHVRRAVFAGEGNPCYCLREGCGGLVKPDIVFFGESLPQRFFQLAPQDFGQADLLIVMGTSLVVQPFASLIDHVEDDTPRLLINRERAGQASPLALMLGNSRGFNFGEGNYRDALYEGDCDVGVRELCRLLGWEQELEALILAGPHPVAEVQAEAAAPRLGWLRVLPGAGSPSRRGRRLRELHAMHVSLRRGLQHAGQRSIAAQQQQCVGGATTPGVESGAAAVRSSAVGAAAVGRCLSPHQPIMQRPGGARQLVPATGRQRWQGLPVLALSRRGRRLHEVRVLHRTLGMKRQRRSMQQLQELLGHWRLGDED